MSRTTIASILLLCCFLRRSHAIEGRPLHVQVVQAYPMLQWPDWVTGIDQGLAKPARPLIVTGAGDGSGRMFVASEYGTVHTFANGPLAKEMSLFLDIRDRVQFDPKYTEEGLLGLAFHPQFSDNGEIFVYYSAKPTKLSRHTSIVARYRRSADNPNVIDPNSEEILLRIKQPYWNHNGGTVAFGPDGYLYIVLGDGGKGGDPHRHAQNLQTLFGSILRIDVDTKDASLPYGIPKDNPFANRPAPVRREIWAYGLRNAWRMAFDRESGECWAADVGQGMYEEINLIVRGGNYGWNLREGRHPFAPNGDESHGDFIEPIWEYDHRVGKSIIGGCVYRGKLVPELEGGYLYADYVTGQIWALWYDHQRRQVVANRSILSSGRPITTFGEDDQGEVYFATEEGGIFRFESNSKAPRLTSSIASEESQ